MSRAWPSPSWSTWRSLQVPVAGRGLGRARQPDVRERRHLARPDASFGGRPARSSIVRHLAAFGPARVARHPGLVGRPSRLGDAGRAVADPSCASCARRAAVASWSTCPDAPLPPGRQPAAPRLFVPEMGRDAARLRRPLADRSRGASSRGVCGEPAHRSGRAGRRSGRSAPGRSTRSPEPRPWWSGRWRRCQTKLVRRSSSWASASRASSAPPPRRARCVSQTDRPAGRARLGLGPPGRARPGLGPPARARPGPGPARRARPRTGGRDFGSGRAARGPPTRRSAG